MRTFLLVKSLANRFVGRRCYAAALNPVLQESGQAFAAPAPAGQSKAFSAKIEKIVADIASLNLLEVAELNDALKKKLNVPDALPMSYSAVAAGPAGPAAGAPKAAKEEEDDTPVVPVKTSFTIKLVKFDETKKMDLIKELRNTIPSMNLVQSKKLVESIPQVLKKDVGKDEVDKIKAALEKVGGKCEIE